MEGVESGDTGRNLEMITDNEEEEASDCEASLNDSTFEGVVNGDCILLYQYVQPPQFQICSYPYDA